LPTMGRIPKTLSEEDFIFLKKQIEISPRKVYTKGDKRLSDDRRFYSDARYKREKASIRQKYQRIRDVAKKEMEDLTKLAEIFTDEHFDKQYNQLFTTEIKEFTNLLKILFTVNIETNDPDILKHREISESRRVAMLKLLDWLLWQIGGFPNVIALAEKSHQTLIMAGLSEYFFNVLGLKAILIEADRECDTTVFRERLKLPGSVARRMNMEGRIGYESGGLKIEKSRK
jgi:hypothetical protein